MKALKFFYLLIATMVMVATVSSCSKDDDNNNESGVEYGVQEVGNTLVFTCNVPGYINAKGTATFDAQGICTSCVMVESFATKELADVAEQALKVQGSEYKRTGNTITENVDEFKGMTKAQVKENMEKIIDIYQSGILNDPSNMKINKEIIESEDKSTLQGLVSIPGICNVTVLCKFADGVCVSAETIQEYGTEELAAMTFSYLQEEEEEAVKNSRLEGNKIITDISGGFRGMTYEQAKAMMPTVLDGFENSVSQEIKL